MSERRIGKIHDAGKRFVRKGKNTELKPQKPILTWWLILVGVIFAIFMSIIYDQWGIILNSMINLLESLSDESTFTSKIPPAANFSRFNIQIMLGDEQLKKKWRPGGRFLREIVKSSLPVLITDSPILSWHLIKTGLQSNSQRIVLNTTRWQHKEPLFLLGQERDKGGMIGSKGDRPLAYINTTLSSFLSSALDPKTFLYWTGELRAWESASEVGRNDKTVNLTNWMIFKVLEKELEGIVDEDDSSIWKPMLWLSHPGVVAQTHYDTHHNFFVQLQGMKRFYLFAPSTELYTFPNIHRSYRQSQAFLEDSQFPNQTASDNKFPKLHGARAIEVTLQPGDVLYIPPYWQHRVESKTLSLSLSVQSPSLVETALAEAYWQPVPFGDFKATAELRVMAATYYLQTVLSAAHGAGVFSIDSDSDGEQKNEAKEEKDIDVAKQQNGEGGGEIDTEIEDETMNEEELRVVREFAAGLYLSRFSFLYPKETMDGRIPDAGTGTTHSDSSDRNEGLVSPQDKDYASNSDKKQKKQQVQAAYRGTSHLPCANTVDTTSSFVLATHKDKFKSAARHLIELLTAVDCDAAVKITFLRDYTEQIARWAVGPDSTARFIFHCLAGI